MTRSVTAATCWTLTAAKPANALIHASVFSAARTKSVLKANVVCYEGSLINNENRLCFTSSYSK